MSDLQALLTPELTMIAVVLLVAFSIGGVLYALFQPSLSGEKRGMKRLQHVKARAESREATQRVRDLDRRRRSVQDQLKEFEERERDKHRDAARPSLEKRISQAGLHWTKQRFWIVSGVCGAVSMVLALFATSSYILTAGIAFVGFFGLPRFYISRRRKKRIEAFLLELPNAVDVIVRGTRAGLPLGECIQIVSTEAREPIATEFRQIIEAQAMGITLSEAIAKLPERVPVPEANFLAIVVAIQSQAGGSLSEALGNLSKVLRERRAMKGKIQAMSQEAKSSAAIIGSLPFLVAGVMSVTSPSYIMVLFTNPTGNMILIGSAIWMTMGMLIMKKMINFDF
ncbi:type II secretion system F family protein [Stappia indica]|uniref:type II secretion system F family protein n=1 Tax=Stappia indica TaxID=538381 RepID=UPI001CD4F9F9|nr:type II secretion system F family protein [Stappia indica]MCA1297549.1 type II secretion system F family protein [Stappia indica]